MMIEFYWRPGCAFCMALRARLDRTSLPVRDVNIWEDADAAARVRSVADGNETVPTVFVGPAALVNPTIDEVMAAVRTHAPELLAS
ncbi:MAG TPA: glutaredoxin domain-containing protein [Amycolatopsis sp.]|uniref:glutaredoxin domain-containing protein n=1 Tax=Amycolatopsis sp. TaxID=37632 RepID=UPI002B485D69|nr:glutaredoxin domain-containing protein [Amycolatopsis sp.]HKS46885.1 glutaredoxin domain-containing protein [Amycolatopsis sp.]